MSPMDCALRHLPSELGGVRAMPIDDGDLQAASFVHISDAKEVLAQLLVDIGGRAGHPAESTTSEGQRVAWCAFAVLPIPSPDA